MKLKLWQAVPTMAASIVFLVQPAWASVTTQQVAKFPDAVESRLVKHHGRLFSINENSDGTISVERTGPKGLIWETIDSEDERIKDLVASTTEVGRISAFSNHVYLATVNTDGLSQVWRVCKGCEPAIWEMSGGAGFGDSTNTEIVSFFQVQGNLVALVSGTNGNALYETPNGEEWSLIGEVGLGVGMTSAVGATRIQLDEDGQYIYIATSEGDIYSSRLDDLVNWELVASVDGTVTAIYRRLVAVTEDGVAKVLRTEDGETYAQVGEDGLGNLNNSSVSRFYHIGGHVFAVTENSVDGAEIRSWKPDSVRWALVTEAGFGDASNVAVTTLIKFHGRRFASTESSTGGTAVYKFKHVLSGDE